MILIDSSVILDIASKDPVWYEWSKAALVDASDRGELCINQIIYAEVSVRYTSPEDLDEIIPAEEFRRCPLPFSAAFLAGKAHAAYRRRGGSRVATLPDFFIGAHALVASYKILARDPRRFRRYFPSVELIDLNH